MGPTAAFRILVLVFILKTSRILAQVRAHQKLLAAFFHGSKRLLKPDDKAAVVVTLKVFFLARETEKSSTLR